tara:strand:+ start:41 stop:490 length:450 start_codon:yes stop_codon:yes gene_type:complete
MKTKKKRLTFKEIENHLDSGHTVHWMNSNYYIVKAKDYLLCFCNNGWCGGKLQKSELKDCFVDPKSGANVKPNRSREDIEGKETEEVFYYLSGKPMDPVTHAVKDASYRVSRILDQEYEGADGLENMLFDLQDHIAILENKLLKGTDKY